MFNNLIKETYTISEAVSATGLGKTSLYKLIKDGEITAKKYGSRTLITATSLREWLSNLPKVNTNGGN